MSNENASRPSRTNGSAPMGSTVAIAITLIALVLGFLILQKVNDDGGSTIKPDDTSSNTSSTTATDPSATTTPPVVTSTTVFELVVDGTKLQVANASNQDGVATQMSTVLATKGFEMVEPTTASEKLTVSKVLYKADDPAAKAVAESLATFFGGITAAAQGMPVPVASGNWADGSGVILMLGNDFAGKTLDQIAGNPTTGTTAPPTT